jgi:hypothetical protein
MSFDPGRLRSAIERRSQNESISQRSDGGLELPANLPETWEHLAFARSE